MADFPFARTSTRVEGLGGLNTSTRRIFPQVSSPLNTSLTSTPSSSSSYSPRRSNDSRSSVTSSSRSNVKTPIGSIGSMSPRETARPRISNPDAHLARSGLRSNRPVGWAMSNNMDKILQQEPMSKRTVRSSNPMVMQSAFGFRAKKQITQQQKNIRSAAARRGDNKSHRIFAETLSGVGASSSSSSSSAPSTPLSPRSPRARNPPPAVPPFPIPPPPRPRPPQNTPPTSETKRSPQERRRRMHANKQRRQAGPIVGSKLETDWQGTNYAHQPVQVRAWNNQSFAAKDVLTNYDQPTMQERQANDSKFHGTVIMPEGHQFRAKVGGLAPGTHHNFDNRGKVVRWMQSKEAPAWMVAQNIDHDALIEPVSGGKHAWATGYHRDGMTGVVGDNTISGEGPSWLVDTMERYNPDLVLHEIARPLGTKEPVLHRAAGTSGDMPDFITRASGHVPDPRKESWYNQKVEPSKKRHSSNECKTDAWEYSMGGVRSKIDLGGGIAIADSSVSGDAPTWMEDLSLRVDPTNVIYRSNHLLDFVNKTFTPEIEKADLCWTDATVSGDAPSWMTEQNTRVDPRIVREVPKHQRPWMQQNAPTSKRDFPKQAKPTIRNPRGRTKTKKRYKDGRNVRKLPNKPGRHTIVRTRAPEGPVNMRNVSGSTMGTTSTGRYNYA